MIQFQANAQTDRRIDKRTDGRTEGQTDPILQELSGYDWGSNNNNNTIRYKWFE